MSAPGAGRRIGNLPVSAVVVIVIAVAVLVWLLFIRGDDDNSDSSKGSGANATKEVSLVSAADLPAEVSGVDNPVFWLGPKSGVNYEVTVISDGRTYVRYLPNGVEKESPDRYLTVGSYAQQNAFDVLKGLGKKQGEGTIVVPDGGIALKNTS